MLTQREKEDILSSFPNIKLSYEKIIHKKVSTSDIIFAIPDGIKCFAWFTSVNDKSVCIILELENNNKKEINNIKIVTTCFSSSLSYGTLFYGTLFNHSRSNFFCIEDIFLYKGTNINGENWKNKLRHISNIFKNDIKQIAYNNSFVIFGLPIMIKNNEELEQIINNSLIKYKLHSIQYRRFNEINTYLTVSFENFMKKSCENVNNEVNIPKIKEETNKENKISQKYNKNIVFEIKPDIQNDIYHLYCNENEYFGTACIPDFKTSKMMNKLFRKIKENDDLDKLEESDDEEEFENPNIDKYVYLDNLYKFECQFNKRFKKWVPYKVVDNNTKLTNIIDIKNEMKKHLTKPFKIYK